MKTRALVALLAAGLCWTCGGGGGGYGGSSTPPTTPSPAPTGTNIVTISIVGDRGATSFSPNPATCNPSQMVVWKNNDTIVHRVVIDGLGIDTGPLNPGASSQPMSLANVSRGYHCSLHPGMVGALNGAETPPPMGEPCGPYGC
jgi:plastocyanin